MSASGLLTTVSPLKVGDSQSVPLSGQSDSVTATQLLRTPVGENERKGDRENQTFVDVYEERRDKCRRQGVIVHRLAEWALKGEWLRVRQYRFDDVRASQLWAAL